MTTTEPSANCSCPPGTANWTYRRRGDRDDARPAGLVCEQPTVLACRTCEGVRAVVCGTARASACEPCGLAHRGRVGRVARSGLVVGRQGLFVTLTAPGERQHRGPDGRVCPCTPRGGVLLGQWNATLGRRWNRLVTELRRRLGPLEYVRCVEVQRRGALHVHAILRSSDGRPLALSAAGLRRLAQSLGFGHEVDVQPVLAHHAGYVAKYAAKGADARPDVPWLGWREVGGSWVNRATGELVVLPRRRVRSFAPTYRTWTASRGWGWSMGQVREAQAHYAATVALLPRWEDRPASAGWSLVPAPLVPGWVDSPAAVSTTA